MNHQKQQLDDLKKPVLILDAEAGHIIDYAEKTVRFLGLSRKERNQKTLFEISPEIIYGNPVEHKAVVVIQEALKAKNRGLVSYWKPVGKALFNFYNLPYQKKKW